MAYTLYEMTYDEVFEANKQELDKVTQEMFDEIKAVVNGKGSMSSFSIGGMEIWSQDRLSFLVQRFNFFKPSMYITDTFLVVETNEKYFKVDLLDVSRDEFIRVGRLDEILEFLSELKFPYEWQYEKFFKLATCF